jgi:NAD(P)-dependent dehydrogenase (short-subunit alcohol dehydrogenase family)
MGSGADYYRDRHVVVTGGTGALGTAMVGALLEAGAAGASVFEILRDRGDQGRR